jgi:hypothetical protein
MGRKGGEPRAAAGKRVLSARPAAAPTPCDGVTITLARLRFTSDHGLLTDKMNPSTSKKSDLDRWLPGGTKYEDIDPAEWQRSPAHDFPISHTKNEKLHLVAEFQVSGPEDASPGEGQVVISGDQGYLTFKGSATFTPKNKNKDGGTTVEVHLVADEPLPDRVQKISRKFTWEVTACGRTFQGRSGPHRIYVTFGTPAPEADLPPFPEEPLGATLKRMDKAVELTHPHDSTDPVEAEIGTTPPKKITLTRPHAIVAGLSGSFPHYELRANKSLKAFSHPDYLNSLGGAWPMADYMEDSGECQAIVRFVRDILKQVGVPGTIEIKYVYADPAHPKTGVEADAGDAYDNTPLALVDQPVKDSDIGKVFPPSHTHLSGGRVSMGFNNYEACMKFTDGGQALYYPGGTEGSLWETPDQVLSGSFYALVKVENAWYPNGHDPDRVEGFRIVEVLARYE